MRALIFLLISEALLGLYVLQGLFAELALKGAQ